jgi:hypothetical protein
MRRYCQYEPGYFDDQEFLSTQHGVIHEVVPRHYARTGSLVQGPTIQAAPFWLPFSDVFAVLARDASEPLAGFSPRIPPRADADEEIAALRVEILRLTDRLSRDDLRACLAHIRRHVSA